MATQGGEELNDAQKRFCEEYIFDFNGTRSYMAAYPNSKENSAAVNATKLLRNTKIQEYIQELQSDLSRVSGISRLKVLQEFEKMAFSSMAELHDTWMSRKEFDKLSKEQKACIQEISTQLKTSRDSQGRLTENEYVKVKLYDKQRALENVNKMLGFNEPEKIQHEGTGLVPLVIKKASDNK